MHTYVYIMMSFVGKKSTQQQHDEQQQLAVPSKRARIVIIKCRLSTMERRAINNKQASVSRHGTYYRRTKRYPHHHHSFVRKRMPLNCIIYEEREIHNK